jgi:hypothetical protein
MPRQDIMVQMNSGLSVGLSKFADNVELVNFYSIPTPNSRSESQLVSIAGSDVITTVPSTSFQGCRGLWQASTGSDTLPTIYGVFGNHLYRISRTGAVTFVGNVSSALGNVTFAENQDQTRTETRGFVCDGVAIYQWDLKASDSVVSSTFSEVDLPYIDELETERLRPAYISYSNYRLIVTSARSPQWYYSELNSSVIPASNFESSEINPDATVRVIAHGNNLWAFSRVSYDIFAYTGSATDPFDVPTNAVGKIGCESGDSISTCSDYMFWLGAGEGSENTVYAADVAGKIQRISDPGIEEYLRKWQFKRSAKGFAYSERGSLFYVLTSKDDDQTLVYDATANRWHIRSTSNDGRTHFWDIIGAVTGYDGSPWYAIINKNIIAGANYDSGKDHNGNPISRLYSSPVYTNLLDYFKLVECKVDVETGTSKSYDIVPEMFVQFSWDGGKVWGERMYRPLGRMGQYLTQVAVWGGGAGRNLVIRIGSSADIPLIVYQMRLVVEKAGRT